MDIEAQSCSTHVTLFGKESEDEADCEDDLEKAISYLAQSRLVIISNEGRFETDNFEDPVKNYSTIIKQVIDETSAHWFDLFVQLQEIEDEISLL